MYWRQKKKKKKMASVFQTFPEFQSANSNSYWLGKWGNAETKEKQSETVQDFPRGPMVNNLPANAGDVDSIPDLGGTHMLQGK